MPGRPWCKMPTRHRQPSASFQRAEALRLLNLLLRLRDTATGLPGGPAGTQLPVQGTQVREDPPRCRATKPVCQRLLSPDSRAGGHSERSQGTCSIHAPQQRSRRGEAPLQHKEDEPPLATARESLRSPTETQCNHKVRFKRVRCKIQDAWGWCTETTQRDGTGREVGGGFRIGNTCIPVADSC